MANMTNLADKIISDPSFCAELVRDPAGTLKTHGIAANDDIISALRGQSAQSLQQLATAFGKQQAAG